MITLRTAAIIITVGVFTGLPLTAAQACDDDRFPCPVVLEATPQVAPAEEAPLAQPLKKANHPARAEDKKAERKAPRIATDREAPGSGTRTKASNTAVQKPAAAPITQKAFVSQNAAEVARAGAQPSPSDQSPKEESRSEGLLAVAGTEWPALPNPDGAGRVADAAEGTPSDAVQVNDANQLNELDRAAIADRTGKASWISYLLLILSAVFAGAAAKWLLPRMRVRVQAPSSKSTNAQEQLADCSPSISR
jgi:hypothetical protein